MIFPKVNVQEWKRKYNIQTYTVKCKRCAASNSPIKPFVTSTSIGLLTESCYNCHAPLRLSSSVPRTGVASKEWNDIMSGIIDPNL
jgi:hypothetical protein